MGTILAPFKKLFTNKLTVTILGVIVGLIVLFIGYRWRINSKINPQRIPYATKTLNPQEEITENVIGYTEVPKDTIVNMNNLVTDINQINGKLVSFDSTIAMNGFFFQENLIDKTEMPDYVFNDIPDGDTVFNLGITGSKNIANSIRSGDKIDLYISTKEEETGKIIYSKLIKSIKVLTVRDHSGKDIYFNNSQLNSEPSVILFAVPENLFLLLSKARLVGGFEIEPVLFNDAYTNSNNQTEIKNHEIEQMILNKTYKLKDQQ